MATADGVPICGALAPPEPPSEASASAGTADRRVRAAWLAILEHERRPDVLRGLLSGLLRAYAERWPEVTP